MKFLEVARLIFRKIIRKSSGFKAFLDLDYKNEE